MARTLTMLQLKKRRHKELAFTGIWRDSLGTPAQGFSAIIFGCSGEGKTDFTTKLAAYLSEFGKVLYVSAEESDRKTIKEAAERNGLFDKDILLGVDYTYEDLKKKVKSRAIKSVIIDSLDYFDITADEFKTLCRFKKNMVVTAWAEGKRPASKHGKDIEYMSDIKIRVVKYLAQVRSRFGGNKDFVIWEERAKTHHHHLNIVSDAQ